MKKSKYIDYAVLMAALSNKKKKQELKSDESGTDSLTGRKPLSKNQKNGVMNAIAIAMLAEGLRE